MFTLVIYNVFVCNEEKLTSCVFVEESSAVPSWEVTCARESRLKVYSSHCEQGHFSFHHFTPTVLSPID